MAETLFRQWFVEEAQEDWEEKPLDEIADFLNGIACQKYPHKNGIEKLPVLKIKELRNGFCNNFDWATTDVKNEYIVHNGDIIFSWSGSLLVKIWDGKKCVLNQHLFKVTSIKYPKWFIYFWTKFHLKKFIEIAKSKATTMGHIKRMDLSHAIALVPTKQELVYMSSISQSLLDKIIQNNRQLEKDNHLYLNLVAMEREFLPRFTHPIMKSALSFIEKNITQKLFLFIVIKGSLGLLLLD